MYTLVAFATQWGSKHGGINSFNTDFLAAFGLAFQQNVQLFCIVADADEEEIKAAKDTAVTLLPLPYPPSNKALTAAEGQKPGFSCSRIAAPPMIPRKQSGSDMTA